MEPWQETNESVETKASNKVGEKALASVISALIVFGVAYYFIHSAVHSVTQSLSPNATPKIPSPTGKVGVQVAYGQLTFDLVSQYTCVATASSQVCKFHILVTNNSSTSADFFDSNQKLADTDGKLYSLSSSTDANGDQFGISMKTLNPGFSLEGYLIFEVPAGVSLSELIVHDSVFSDGAGIGL